jgi:hypothetical protein
MGPFMPVKKPTQKVIRTIDINEDTLDAVADLLGIRKSSLKPGRLLFVHEGTDDGGKTTKAKKKKKT